MLFEINFANLGSAHPNDKGSSSVDPANYFCDVPIPDDEMTITGERQLLHCGSYSTARKYVAPQK
jgi:hypothetical protein